MIPSSPAAFSSYMYQHTPQHRHNTQHQATSDSWNVQQPLFGHHHAPSAPALSMLSSSPIIESPSTVSMHRHYDVSDGHVIYNQDIVSPLAHRSWASLAVNDEVFGVSLNKDKGKLMAGSLDEPFEVKPLGSSRLKRPHSSMSNLEYSQKLEDSVGLRRSKTVSLVIKNGRAEVSSDDIDHHVRPKVRRLNEIYLSDEGSDSEMASPSYSYSTSSSDAMAAFARTIARSRENRRAVSLKQYSTNNKTYAIPPQTPVRNRYQGLIQTTSLNSMMIGNFDYQTPITSGRVGPMYINNTNVITSTPPGAVILEDTLLGSFGTGMTPYLPTTRS
jgi:hypothetical protein